MSRGLHVRSDYEPEIRNTDGLPIVTTAPENRGNIHQNVSQDNSVNKSLPWIVFSWFLSGGAIVGLILIALIIPEIIASRTDAAVTKAKAEFAQQLAEVRASANTAREHARVALDKVEQTQVQLGAKGLIVPETH